MTNGLYAGNHLGYETESLGLPQPVLKAIADKKRFEELLITNDLDQEAETLDLDDEADAAEEFLENQADLELGDEDLSGGSADSGDGSDCEPQDCDDLGDSDNYLAEGDPLYLFDQERSGQRPRISDLPLEARPIVRFAIDTKYGVRPLEMLYDPHFELRHLLALAVARHLKQCDVVLTSPGDWTRIPVIGSEDELLRLAMSDAEDTIAVDSVIELRVAARRSQKAVQRFQSKRKDAAKKGQEMPKEEEETRLKESRSQLQEKLNEQLRRCSPQFQALHSRLKDYGAHLKSMGIGLPNGEVVTISVLMDAARQGKRATLAAAFRESDRHPPELAGEAWNTEDWTGFEESQRKAKYRKKDR